LPAHGKYTARRTARADRSARGSEPLPTDDLDVCVVWTRTNLSADAIRVGDPDAIARWRDALIDRWMCAGCAGPSKP
jgi:hypothetical protein